MKEKVGCAKYEKSLIQPFEHNEFDRVLFVLIRRLWWFCVV